MKNIYKQLGNIYSRNILKENFGETAPTDLEQGPPDEGAGDESLEGEEETVTLTLDKATAQKLLDVLSSVIDSGEDVDGDFGGESEDSGGLPF